MTAYFLVAGAQRSGTTFLYHLLDQHPEIEMARPLRPEPKFFLREEPWALDRSRYDRGLFAGKPGARLRGEKSTSYMERSDVARRALTVLSDVKVIFLLRDPVERAISNYRFSLEQGVEHASPAYAFRHEEQRRERHDRQRFSVSPFMYLGRGHYHRFLERWEAALGRARLFLIVFEQLIADPTVVRACFEWLDVDSTFAPVVPPLPVNASTRTVEVRPELRRHLVEHFQESNRVLEERYGLDVSRWQS